MRIKKAFTLAEIMIVLTIIGVLTMILLPIANHSRPDENVMKFKKADTTLKNVIHELVTSSDYYAEGDLGRYKNGNYIKDYKYFCNSFADVISVKSSDCEGNARYFSSANGKHNVIVTKAKEKVDDFCKAVAPSTGKQIVAQDGVAYFETTPGYTFSGVYADKNNQGDDIDVIDNIVYVDKDIFGDDLKGKYSFMYSTWDGIAETPEHVNTSNSNFLYLAKVFCIDIDGVPDNATSSSCINECPFGYAIRVDGKILSGARADEWLEKGFQKGSNEN